MIEILFQDKEDAIKLLQYFTRRLANCNLLHENILLIEDKNIVILRIHSVLYQQIEVLKEAFHSFIVEFKQHDWFKKILKEQFFYEDEEEIQQILEVIFSVLEGERQDICSLMDDLDSQQQLKWAVDQMFHENISFSFDSFVRFRLRAFMDQLEKCVELSIDEYKMEQEYQMFIQTLREFLMNRTSKLNHLHLIIAENTVFFDEQFYEIKRAELIRMIDRKLLSNHPVYIDSVTIAPLLSIAPSTIYLYTEDYEQPLVRTIRNIFEERVILKPISSFYEEKSKFPLIAEEKF